MSRPGSLVVLAVTTWAFVVCFAVWLMFGVIGIPIKHELNLNALEFGLLTSTPVLTGSLFRLPLGIWTHRFGTGSSCSCCWLSVLCGRGAMVQVQAGRAQNQFDRTN
jgi:nitrate/nitrite transporter NarK